MKTKRNSENVKPPDIRGEVRRDDLSRQLYSTDASIYQVHPDYVCIPADEEDIASIVRWANNHDLPVTPRGSGTSLSGQSIGPGAVVDFSRHLNDIVEYDPTDETITVQPGVILDHLNDFLAERGVQFGPDVATSSRANIGGMIGNNSAGAHSIRYGHTSDHVDGMKCVLSNGEQVYFEPISRAVAEERAQGTGLEARLYRELPALIENHADLIRDRYPEIQRNSSGYGLDRFLAKLDDGVVDFTELICGSEGTLASVVEATLNVVPAPEDRGALVYHADSVLEAMELNQRLVEETPYAIELIDDTILDLARQSLETSRILEWVEGEPSALLIVEQASFQDSSPLRQQLEDTTRDIREWGFEGNIVEATTEEELEHVWKVRKAGLPLLLGLPGNEKPTTFVEDTAVDPTRLADYVRDFQELVADHGTTAAFYGHASVGCLHIRPLVNLKSEQGMAEMRALAEDAFDLVLDYHGVISGEHGVGRARSEWLDEMYGPEIMELFESVKHCFDPDNRFNPGNIVDPQPMTDHLRFGADYDAGEFDTIRDFSDKDGFTEFVELCNGNGACRKENDGVMCPSYMVTREEKHSTRGRANALRGLLDGDLDPDSLTDGTMEEVMELCISCKGCKSECPTGIDMAPMKEEVLHKVHRENGSSFRDRFFARVGSVARKMSGLQPLFEAIQKIPGLEFLVKKILNIAPERSLPRIRKNHVTFQQFNNSTIHETLKDLDRPVVLYVDTFSGYVEPGIARSARRVLESAGFDVLIPEMPCCGRPMMSKGFLDKAKKQVEQNLEILAPFAEKEVPIVGLEPSCVSALTDDFVRFVPGEQSTLIADQTQLFTDFLATNLDQLSQRSTQNVQPSTDVLIHGHCHEEALYGLNSAETLFSSLTEGEVRSLDSGCCGMAGSFGFEAEHVEHSRAMGERVLLPEVRESDRDTVLVASGTSCRQQVADFTDKSASHPAEVIDDWLT